MITKNYCATRQRWRRMGGLPKQWVNKKIGTCSMYFLIHMLTPGSIACCSVIYCFTDDEDDGAWNCCHPQGLLVPSSNVNQPKANSTHEGVKSIVAQTGKTRKRKPKTDKSTDEQTAIQASLVRQKVEKPVCQHKVSLSLLAVLIAIALALLIIYF